MEQILNDIECIPGVSGVCCFCPQQGIVAKGSTCAITDHAITSVSRTLFKVFSAGIDSFGGDIKKISLQYNETGIMITEATSEHFLVIFYNHTLNKNLLGMAITEAVKTFKKHNTGLCAEFPEKHVYPIKAESLSKNKPFVIEDVLNSESVSQALASMEKFLNRIMGPMAAIVFNDTLQIWINKCRENNNLSMEQLADLLFDEINDSEKIETYKIMIAPCLNSFRS